MEITNIGIVAHVDAGKTSLTERILYETGVIRTLGRVDHGNTQTDTLELERERGITIAAAVVSFQLGDLKVNLIDTPGHPDFIAEVDRSLRVLDGVVLVVSAVEGVQPQTRRLLHVIESLRLPLIVFVNKIDRAGARGMELLPEIAGRVSRRLITFNAPRESGGAAATATPIDETGDPWWSSAIEILAEASDELLEAYVSADTPVSPELIERELRRQVATGIVTPVCFGSARTGAGVEKLLECISRFFPRPSAASDAPLTARVFKVQRGANSEKVALARIDAGVVRARERVRTHRPRSRADEPGEARITLLERFERGRALAVDSLGVGEIAILHGLKDVQIGDALGHPPAGETDSRFRFAPPTMISVVRAADPRDSARLGATLQWMAEQDPLINLRVEDEAGALSVSLFGEVQKEVIAETIRRETGIRVFFSESRTLCVERVVGTGLALEVLGESDTPYLATIGVRVEPGDVGSGIEYDYEPGSLPHAFYRATEETIRESLEQGMCNWPVVDCRVTLTDVGYCPITTAGDFRRLAPLVVAQALTAAGTIVCEPYERFELDVPSDVVADIVSELIKHRAACRDIVPGEEITRLVGAIPAAETQRFEQRLPGLSRGEGEWLSTFESYEPVAGDPPARNRIGPNPFNRAHYMAEVAQR